MARMKRVSRSDLMDEFLESKGLHRKHIARDATCLFRAVSEQIYCTQSTYAQILRATVRYMHNHREDFEYMIEDDFDEYLQKLKELKVLAGRVEMKAISRMMDVGFIIFKEIGKLPTQIGSASSMDKKVVLCCSYDQHYDSIYPRSYLAVTAFCQAVVYEVLYKKVFRMGSEVTKAVEKMLHDKNYTRQRRAHLPCPMRLPDHFDADGNPEAEVRAAIEQGIPPFPFKVAKALDPDIYRNVEYDAWNEIRKDQIREEMNGTADFQPGDKCLVTIDKEKDEWHVGHIQEMNPNKGPVTVFVEELGEKCTVPYENLEILQSYREPNKSRYFKGRRIRDYSLSVAMNSSNYHFRPKPHLSFKSLNRYQRSLSLHPSNFSQLNGSRNQFVRSGSVCSKEETSSLEASNEVNLNESHTEEIPCSTFCQPQYCTTSNCAIPSSNYNVAATPMPSNEMTYNGALHYNRPAAFHDSEGSDTGSQGQSHSYQSMSYDVSPQLSATVMPPMQPFGVTNSLPDPMYAINQNACRSVDVNGNDLPLSDVNTLRFFYNLGLDYYRMSIQNPATVPTNGYNAGLPVCTNPPVFAINQPLNTDSMLPMTHSGNFSCMPPASQPVPNTLMYGPTTPVFIVPPMQGTYSGPYTSHGLASQPM